MTLPQRFVPIADKRNHITAEWYQALSDLAAEEATAVEDDPGYSAKSSVLQRWVNVTVTSGIVSAKGFSLPLTPSDPLQVEIVMYGGISQQSGVDFVVSGNQVSWASLAMELLVEVGQALTVRYV